MRVGDSPDIVLGRRKLPMSHLCLVIIFVPSKHVKQLLKLIIKILLK